MAGPSGSPMGAMGEIMGGTTPQSAVSHDQVALDVRVSEGIGSRVLSLAQPAVGGQHTSAPFHLIDR